MKRRMLIINATVLRKLIMNIFNNYNNTFNLTDDLYSLINRSNFRNLRFDNANETKPNTDFYCGGRLEEFAIWYAQNYHPYFAIVVCVFGTVSNILNIAVLTGKDMACAPINRILTALAVADMMVMIEYIPFVVYYYLILMGKRDFPYLGAVYMLLHMHLTQVFHTISICLTLTLAIWRYLAIGYPGKNHILCSEIRCTIAISISFFLPIILCTPTYFTVTIQEKEVVEDKTYILYVTDLNRIFKKNMILLKVIFWIYAVVIKLLPCFILTVISCWLIRTLLKAKKRKQVLRGYDSYPLTPNDKTPPATVESHKKKITKAERRADRTTKMLVAVLLLFLLTEFPQGILAFLIGVKGEHFFLDCYQTYGDLIDILALLNGAINFILYCCMNRMFRVSFGQLFKHKILAKWAPVNASDIHTTTPNVTNTTEM